uniref:Uncharacterized protein n=1 Tax=Solanum tuberosum TaxID=4113 RepID=M0ZXX1_SOLTU
MRSFRTPTCRMRNILHLNPLTLSSLVCGNETRIHSLDLNLMSIHYHRPSTDYSASLVGIADQLGDLPFGIVHRRLAPAFNIVVLWVIVRHSTALKNFLAMRRLLPFSADLILSFRAQHTVTKGEVRPFGD